MSGSNSRKENRVQLCAVSHGRGGDDCAVLLLPPRDVGMSEASEYCWKIADVLKHTPHKLCCYMRSMLSVPDSVPSSPLPVTALNVITLTPLRNRVVR